MVARLGNVIYWGSCGLSVLLLLVALFVFVSPGESAEFWIVIYIGAAVGSWLIGRAIRYVLSNK